MDPRCLIGVHGSRRLTRTDFLITGGMGTSRCTVTTWWECPRCGRVSTEESSRNHHSDSPRDRPWYHPSNTEVDYSADSRGIGWTVDAAAEEWTPHRMEDHLRERAGLPPAVRL